MNRIRRFAIMLAGLAGAVLAFSTAAAPAFATLPPAGPRRMPVPPAQVHTIVTGGTPGWQIVLIAAGAALLAAILAVLLDRMRASRRHMTAPTT
ncbi:MAG TPA: hypothetical protein VEC76_09155 [Streptosporangiaceae bacterium]|nr:hypothetical protein [Streptosporangiaceae bacterium]